MAFSAATCLTDIPNGVTSFNVYLGQNNYTSPNLIASSVPVSSLTDSCPYIINNIPDGTTYLSFKDSSGTFCISIPIQNNNICDNCDLGFSNYSATTISKIYCGILTGSCQNNITDYLIHWYGPDNTTTLEFTSGKGNLFTYEVPHPFSSETTSIAVSSGNYAPVIQNVVLNGISYSNTGGTGNILFSGNCLPTINVLPLTCNVSTNTDTRFGYSSYTNFLNFDYQTQGTPLTQSFTYKISGNTKYLVWAFLGEQNPDRIRIEFSGLTYPNKIGLEDFVIGTNVVSNNFSTSTYPMSAKTTSNRYFVKYTCLTGITVNNNDNIIITVTPAISDSKWELFISCLDDYECDDCLSTQDYKIIKSTISGTTTTGCDLSVRFNISGCSRFDLLSDYIPYYSLSESNNVITNSIPVGSSNNILTGNITPLLYFDNTECRSQNIITLPSNLTNCATGTTKTIYDKTFLLDGRGVYGFTGSSTFISTYYNSIRNAFLGLPPYSLGWTSSTNSNDVSYYRYYTMKIPAQSSAVSCLDGRLDRLIYIHGSSLYVTGVTGSDYFLKITANTISNNITFPSCYSNCDITPSTVVSQVNNMSTGSTPNNGTDRDFINGMYYTNPIFQVSGLVLVDTPKTGHTFINGYFITPDWSFNTYPFSGIPSTIIPSLSGTVCNYNTSGVKEPIYNSYNIKQYKYLYQVRLTNENDLSDFDIWASPITNFAYSGSPTTPQNAFYELAYRYSGGSEQYFNPIYII